MKILEECIYKDTYLLRPVVFLISSEIKKFLSFLNSRSKGKADNKRLVRLENTSN